MPLKTFVKVGNITNLSDARYCAGMGVDMLVFKVIAGQENYIPAKTYQEIRGWVSGPKIVAEIYGISSPEELPSIVENFAPDYFELSYAEFVRLADHLTKPLIVRTAPGELNKLKEAINVDYILMTDIPEQNVSGIPLLLQTASSSIIEQTLNKGIAGYALSGSQEERPGFKEYAELADILEFLDE